jgi:secreted trypsin-like serine protease
MPAMRATLRFVVPGLSVAFFTACAAPDVAPAITSSSAPVVGGTLDRAHQSVIAVSGIDDGDEGPFCTGTVISKRTVLTAGHCVDPPRTTPKEIWFGVNLLQPEHKIKVVASKRHPGYHNAGDEVAHDLALLELASDAPVQPSPLLRATMDDSPTYIGKDFTFVGYGVTNPEDHSNPDASRHVGRWPVTLVGPGPLPIVNRQLPATGILSQSPTMNLCNGDSGGPAFFVGSGVELEAGVASTVITAGSCRDGSVSSRTDKPEIDAFIQGVLDEFERRDPCRSDGACNESCNHGGEVGDPDCAANHCQRDGICARACVAPADPDCSDL